MGLFGLLLFVGLRFTLSSLRLDFEALSPSGSLRFVSFIGLRFALSSY